MTQDYLLAPGVKVQERYEIRSALGQGTMGEVYSAYDHRLKRPVAIKLLPLRLADEWRFPEDEFLERFRRECQTLAAVNHPNVVTIHDSGDHYGHPFLVMELLDGSTVKDLIRAQTIDSPSAFRMAYEVSRALGAIHAKGIIHRDVKPANIIVTESCAKLTDFGIARHAQGLNITQVYRQGECFGTIGYTAPEIINGQEPTPATDQFSLGLTLYAALTKREPHVRSAADFARYLRECTTRAYEPPSRYNHRVQPHWDDTILRMITSDPEKRFPSMSEAAAALQEILDQIQRPGDATVPIKIRPGAFTLDDIIANKDVHPHGAHSRFGDRLLVRPDIYARATGKGQYLAQQGRPTEHEVIACTSRTNPAVQKIGRDPSRKATLLILDQSPEPAISRTQAEIARYLMDDKRRYTIRDLGARNPTSLNGVALGQKPMALQSGDIIGIADVRYVFTDTIEFLDALKSASPASAEENKPGTAEHRKRKNGLA